VLCVETVGRGGFDPPFTQSNSPNASMCSHGSPWGAAQLGEALVITVNIALMCDGYPTPTRRTQGAARGRHSTHHLAQQNEWWVKSSKL
jgi:hypothetical protein